MKEELRHLNKTERKVVSSFVKELRDRLGDDIVTIRLFGSKVKGDFQEDSDIDIFILVKQKTAEIEDTIAEIEVDYDRIRPILISRPLQSI